MKYFPLPSSKHVEKRYFQLPLTKIFFSYRHYIMYTNGTTNFVHADQRQAKSSITVKEWSTDVKIKQKKAVSSFEVNKKYLELSPIEIEVKRYRKFSIEPKTTANSRKFSRVGMGTNISNLLFSCRGLSVA